MVALQNSPRLRTEWEELDAATSRRPYDAVVVHTYCPAHSVIPLRGALVFINLVLPPGSKRRYRMFDLVGRRP